MSDTISNKFKQNIIETNSMKGGLQTLYRFNNDYGASVVKHSFSYGLELAVIFFIAGGWHIDYTTHITDDVIGHIDDLDKILQDIKDL